MLLHFGAGGLPTVKGTSIAGLASYGEYGVHVFFVISGFVIPYALYRAGYRLRNFFRHIGRRFVRIDPPAFISILLVAALYGGALLVKGEPIDGMKWPGISFRTILANLTYTVDYLDTGWYNDVFWTLAIEFQFYLLIGLMLPLWTSRREWLVCLLALAVLALHYLPVYSFFKYGSFFVAGIVLFLHREKLLGKAAAVFLIGLSLALTAVQHDLAAAIFASATVLCIGFFSFSSVVTDHLGKISFSLYLTHLFTGWSAEIVVSKFIFVPQSEAAKLAMLLVYLLCSVAFATVFHWLVEARFMRLARKIPLKPQSPPSGRPRIALRRRRPRLRPQSRSIHTGA